MKPTQMEMFQGSINQIPAWAKVSGDIRLTPFYEVKDVMTAVEKYVEELNAGIQYLDTRGPCSKYDLPGGAADWPARPQAGDPAACIHRRTSKNCGKSQQSA